MSDEGHLKIAGYVKKQENILSSSANSLHNLNISVYCTVSFVCLCVGGGGWVGGYECKGMLFVFPHYHCFQSLQVFLFLRHMHVIWVLQKSSFFIYLRAPWCPILFGVIFPVPVPISF